jgi:broad specificity phosphatase PhoE
MTTRHLYLTRHGEATESLTPTGREQALLLGKRLRQYPISTVVHGPSERTSQTAALIAPHLGDVGVSSHDAAGDYVPYAPSDSELPPDSADRYRGFLQGQPAAVPALAEQALDLFTKPDGRDELVVTHNFLIGWIVSAALQAPPWRWLTLNHSNAGLTIIKYAPGRPAALVCFNDTGHLAR